MNRENFKKGSLVEERNKIAQSLRDLTKSVLGKEYTEREVEPIISYFGIDDIKKWLGHINYFNENLKSNESKMSSDKIIFKKGQIFGEMGQYVHTSISQFYEGEALKELEKAKRRIKKLESLLKKERAK